MSIARIMEIGDVNVIVYYNFLFILDAVKSIASIFHSFFLSCHCVFLKRCSLDNMYGLTDIRSIVSHF